MAESNSAQSKDVRFGRTVLTVAIGELVDQVVDVLIVSGNQRAMFAAGSAGTLWTAAGVEVERELRGHAPLTLGTAIPTGSGHLTDHGVHTIIHTIVAPGLGEAARPLIIPDALEQAFDAVDHARGRSFAMPIIGVGNGASAEQRMDAARVLVETLIAHLRTRKHRIEHGILISRFEDDRVPLETLLIRARERLWTS